MNEPTLDVSGLPTYAFGRRDPRWVAVLLLMAIEGSVFGLVLFAYFYTRTRLEVWPPTNVGHREVAYGAVTLGLLLASVWPVHRVNGCVYAGDLLGAKRWLFLATVVSAAALTVRAFEFTNLPFRWDSNAYGSLFWAVLCLHTMHLVAGNIENGLFLALLERGPIEKKHLVDLEVNGIYWYFVVFSWLPLYAVVYLDGVVAW